MYEWADRLINAFGGTSCADEWAGDGFSAYDGPVLPKLAGYTQICMESSEI
jgi:hypothetical protein